jgi:MFS family permease
MGLGDSFGMPAGTAIVPSLLPDHLLPVGNVVKGIVAKVGTIVGPGLGGLSVAVFGADKTFAAIAVSFLARNRHAFSHQRKTTHYTGGAETILYYRTP